MASVWIKSRASTSHLLLQLPPAVVSYINVSALEHVTVSVTFGTFPFLPLMQLKPYLDLSDMVQFFILSKSYL